MGYGRAVNLFGWLKKDKNVPRWAKGLSDRQFEAFKAASLAYFVDRGDEVEAYWEEGYLKPKSGPLTGHELGLHNLVRIAGKAKPEVIHREAAQFWGHMAETELEHAKATSSWEEAQKCIKIRPMSTDSGIPMEFVSGYMIAPGLKAALVLDLSRTVSTLNDDALAAMGVSFDQAVEEAKKRTLAHLREGFKEMPIDPEGGMVSIVSEADSFVASWMLLGEDLFARPPRYGAVVAVPSRHMILICPLDSPLTPDQAMHFSNFARQAASEMPGVISEDCYWLWENHYHSLGTPEGFAAMKQVMEG
jgi:hypothetical protein